MDQVCGSIIEVDIELSELATLQRLKRLVNTMTSAHDKMIIEEYEDLVVRLPLKATVLQSSICPICGEKL